MQNTVTSSTSAMRNISYGWVIPLGCAWPAILLGLGMDGAGQWPGYIILESMYLLPTGLLSAALLIFLLQRAASRTCRWLTLIGYLLASPVGFRLSTLAGLLALEGVLYGLQMDAGEALQAGYLILWPPLWATVCFGILPLSAASLLGYALGALWDAGARWKKRTRFG